MKIPLSLSILEGVNLEDNGENSFCPRSSKPEDNGKNPLCPRKIRKVEDNGKFPFAVSPGTKAQQIYTTYIVCYVVLHTDVCYPYGWRTRGLKGAPLFLPITREGYTHADIKRAREKEK